MTDDLISENKLKPEISKIRILEDIQDVLEQFCGDLKKEGIEFKKNDLLQIVNLIYDDLKERVAQDPISLSEDFIYSLSRSFKVIFYYRIAHFIFNLNEVDELLCKASAFKISEYATLQTAIEIHPEAKIGSKFVIDHGVNTLIGATSEIGDNCTVLNNVLLGSRKITNNKLGKRHPTIGNGVHVSSGVRILGPVFIGDNSKIGPDCVIKNDVPSNSVIELVKRHTVQCARKRNVILGFSSICLAVKSLERSMQLYEGLDGLDLCHFDEQRKTAVFWIGGIQKSKLVLMEQAEGTVSKSYFSLECNSDFILNQLTEYLENRGFEICNPLNQNDKSPLVAPWLPSISLFVKDDDGHQIEFIGRLNDEPIKMQNYITVEEWKKLAQKNKNG